MHAHPDDEASKGAATAARYVKEGVDVLVVTCTGGERGDVLNTAAQPEVDQWGLPEVRQREMAAAVQALGVEHQWLGFEDSGYPAHLDGGETEPLPPGCFAEISVEQAAAPLIDIVRQFRPHVMTTYDEFGGYPHPDHIRTHEIAWEAFHYSDDIERYPGGTPWRPAKLYYNMTFHQQRVHALHAALVERDIESPFTRWLDHWAEEPPADDAWRVTTQVLVTDFLDHRDAALIAHRTQVDPEGMWFAVPRQVEIDVWPTEDFQLALSRVESTIPENDLFAGLRGVQWTG